jgi:hypothetical protein
MAQPRAIIAAEIERLIDLLDWIDGDADFEPDIDCGADDIGEVEGDTFMERAA